MSPSVSVLGQPTSWVTSQPSHIQFLIGICVTLALAVAVELVSTYVLKRLVQQTTTTLDDTIQREAHLPLFVSVVAVGLYYSTTPLTLPPTLDSALASTAASVSILLWARALIRGGAAARRQFPDDRGKAEVLPIVQNVWTVLIVSVTGMAVLSVWNIDITPFLASAGIVGISVGFAAKDTVANFFGAIALYFDDTYSVGDYITLASGEAGVVEDITIRSTVLRTRDDRQITIPNATLNSSVVTNESAPLPPRRITVAIGVNYGVDVDVVEDTLLQVAEDHPDVSADPEPHVRFRAFGDSGLQYELRCWIPSPNDQPRITHELNRAVYNAFAEKDIGIPYPQRDVHLDAPLESAEQTER